MVISRTLNTLKEVTKSRHVYYTCWNWINKCTSVCHSKAIRVDKANKYVFSRITELISSEKMVKSIVTMRKNTLHIMRNEQEIILNQEKFNEVSYELVKNTLKKFSYIMTIDMTRQKQKKLLHMIIFEITINEKREVDSINIKLTDHLIKYLKSERGVC